MSEEQPIQPTNQQQSPPILQPPKQPQLEYYPPTQQPYQYKIFINQHNSYVGSQLIQIFRNDDQIQVNPNIIVSTLNKTDKLVGQIDEDVCKIIDINNRSVLDAVLAQSDIIVYHLNQHNFQDFQYIIKFLSQIARSQSISTLQNKSKKIVCISSIKTWTNNTTDGNMLNNNILIRNNVNTYQVQLQNLCLNINNLSANIQATVIYSGLIYGYGQDLLFARFKRALEQERKLKIYGNGTNIIPTIHLEDLCCLTKKLVYQESKNSQRQGNIRYYFAVDKSNHTQQQIIKNIATTLGNGEAQNVDVQNAWLQPDFDDMLMDLKVDNSLIPQLQQWHSEKGMIENMGTIVSQFNLYRGLKPNKIAIIGAPAAGKSQIANFLKNAYGLPWLNIKDVIEELKIQEDEFATQMKVKIQQLRAQKIEEQRKAFEEAKKKKKGKKDAVEDFDPDKVVARLPDQDLIKIYKRRLNKSDCLNKGYILDGWPKTAQQCEILFKNQQGQICDDILPNACFFIDAPQEQIKQRIKNLAPQKKQGTHWNQQATTRRYQTYIKDNEQGSVKSFLEGKVDIKDVNFNYEDPQQFIAFIERNGPLGFKKTVKKQQVRQQNAEKQEQQNAQKDGQENANKKDDSDQSQPQPEDSQQPQPDDNDADFDIEKLTAHQKQILNEKSRPIRQYLIDNVIPQITQGLLQICKDTPRDPINYLIKFLQTKQELKARKK